jgi:hypothetical protein
MDRRAHFDQLYEAFQSSRLDGVLAMMSEEVRWPNA